MLKKIILIVITFTILTTLWSISPALAQNFVVPPEFENQQGILTEGMFLCLILPNGLRVQAVYPGDDLIAGTIGGFSIRTVDGFSGVGPSVVPNITVIASTTDAEPGELSNIFEDNTGPDAQTVFSGDLNIGPVPACNTNPCPFNIPVTFQTPFQYNPSDGNLLLDMIVPSCMDGMTLFIFVDSVPELSAIFATNSNATEGSPALWSIVQFTYIEKLASVPTLSQWGLMAMVAGLGLIGFFVARRRKSAL